MRKYLAAKGWKTPDKVMKGSDGSRWFTVLDPEGNKVEFVQPPANAKAPDAPNAIGHHIIHVGFLVHNRAKEDTFYRDLLGFKPYWFGGMIEGKIDWVSQQVPDGHDWLEYMLTSGALGLRDSRRHVAAPAWRARPFLHRRSVSSRGLQGARSAATVLAGSTTSAPKIGKDGKYQFNLYDPDGIRTELMNFHATEKPCCSPFTASDPAE